MAHWCADRSGSMRKAPLNSGSSQRFPKHSPKHAQSCPNHHWHLPTQTTLLRKGGFGLAGCFGPRIGKLEVKPVPEPDRIRDTIERIFEGATPKSIIVYADYPGSDKVRVACVGSTLELKALMTVGAHQLY